MCGVEELRMARSVGLHSLLFPRLPHTVFEFFEFLCKEQGVQETQPNPLLAILNRTLNKTSKTTYHKTFSNFIFILTNPNFGIALG